MTQLRRGVVGVIAAFVVVSLSFSAQAGEKKKLTGINKIGPHISRTVVYPGDDPKHELVMFVRRDTTTSSDPDWNETEQIVYQQADSVAGTGTARGIQYGFSKMETQTTHFEGHSVWRRTSNVKRRLLTRSQKKTRPRALSAQCRDRFFSGRFAGSILMDLP
jgi:hypothetical protein